MADTGYVQQLREKLVQRLADDWETKWKPLNHGQEFINFGSVKNKNSFYAELKDEIDKALVTRFGLAVAAERSISADSIRRLLDERWEGGFSEKLKDAVSIHLGYDSWEEFKARQEGVRTSLKLPQTTPQPLVTSIWKRKMPLLWMTFLFLSFLLLAVFSKSKPLLPKSTSKLDTVLLIKCVEQATQAEFIAYQNLPDKLDTIALQKVFTKDGAAYKRIKNVLIKSQQKRQRINNEGNPSTFEITSVRFIKLENNQAHLETEEFWFLKWFNDVEQRYIKGYREHNRQMYILVKEGERWKVKSNYYDGHNYTISPDKPLNQL